MLFPILWAVTLAVVISLLVQSRRARMQHRIVMEASEDRFTHLNRLYRALEDELAMADRRESTLINDAYERGLREARDQIFTEHGEVRTAFGHTYSMGGFMQQDWPSGAIDPAVYQGEVQQRIEHERDEFILASYREGFGIRSKIDIRAIMLDDPFTQHKTLRFRFQAVGTQLVATPSDWLRLPEWTIADRRPFEHSISFPTFDTGSVGVRPQNKE